MDTNLYIFLSVHIPYSLTSMCFASESQARLGIRLPFI